MRTRSCLNLIGVGLVLAGLSAAGAWAQSETPQDESALTTQPEAAMVPEREAPVAPLAPSQSPAHPPLAAPAVDPGLPLWPRLTPIGLTWLAVLVILMLTIQLRPLGSMRNLDGLVLAGTCLLLALRSDTSSVAYDPLNKSWQWWSYALLAVVAGYWFLRGMQLVRARGVLPVAPNLSDGASLVLLVAGLVLAFQYISTAPLSSGSRDGMVGGVHFLKTGKLPYGDTSGYDTRSPLVYLAHAGAAALMPPDVRIDGQVQALEWENRRNWDTPGYWEHAELSAARVVNGTMFVLTLLGIIIIGQQLISVHVGLMLAAVFCVFPGAMECLARPEIMIAAALLSWSLAAALLGGFGSFFALLLVVFAGLTWPWAWLGVPVLLGYFFRHGWPAVTATLGFLGGAAAIVGGLSWLTAPAPPSPKGALSAAGLLPIYAARANEDGTIIIERQTPEGAVETGPRTWLWKFLVESESQSLADAPMSLEAARVALPTGVDQRSVYFRSVAADESAVASLRSSYRDAMSEAPGATRAWVALRTVLERTWLTDAPREAVAGAWPYWASGELFGPDVWIWIRRVLKLVAVALACFFGFAFLAGPRRGVQNLVGAILALTSLALVISLAGPVMNIVVLMPVLLAALALRGEERPAGRPQITVGPVPPISVGPAPRISVNN